MLADAHETTLTRLIRAHSTCFVGAALVLLVVIGAVSPTGAAARDSIALNTPNSPVNNGSQPAVQQLPLPSQMNLEVIVKACPQVETSLEPINQGHSYDSDRPVTLDERKAYYAKLGCIDVPIPPEWMTQEITYDGCKGHAGYLASMRFLAQRQDLKSFPAVGYWVCVPQEFPVSGATGM